MRKPLLAALIMAFDFLVKLGPMFPSIAGRLNGRHPGVVRPEEGP
jgi:hypothetical protein